MADKIDNQVVLHAFRPPKIPYPMAQVANRFILNLEFRTVPAFHQIIPAAMANTRIVRSGAVTTSTQ